MTSKGPFEPKAFYDSMILSSGKQEQPDETASLGPRLGTALGVLSGESGQAVGGQHPVSLWWLLH